MMQRITIDGRELEIVQLGGALRVREPGTTAWYYIHPNTFVTLITMGITPHNLLLLADMAIDAEKGEILKNRYEDPWHSFLAMTDRYYSDLLALENKRSKT